MPVKGRDKVMWGNIKRIAKEMPGATTLAVVALVTFIGLCLYLWIGLDTIWKLVAVLVWILFMAALAQICAAIDLGRI